MGDFRRRSNEEKFSISRDRHGFGGDIRIDRITGLQGHRVGTYVLHEIINWLKSFNLKDDEEKFEMKPINLTDFDAQGVNGLRRKKLYEDAGIMLILKEEGSGHSDPNNKLLNLKLNKNWQKNIRVYEGIYGFKNYMFELYQQIDELSKKRKELEKENKELKEKNENLKQENRRKNKNMYLCGFFILVIIISVLVAIYKL